MTLTLGNISVVARLYQIYKQKKMQLNNTLHAVAYTMVYTLNNL